MSARFLQERGAGDQTPASGQEKKAECSAEQHGKKRGPESGLRAQVPRLLVCIRVYLPRPPVPRASAAFFSFFFSCFAASYGRLSLSYKSAQNPLRYPPLAFPFFISISISSLLSELEANHKKRGE